MPYKDKNVWLWRHTRLHICFNGPKVITWPWYPLWSPSFRCGLADWPAELHRWTFLANNRRKQWRKSSLSPEPESCLLLGLSDYISRHLSTASLWGFTMRQEGTDDFSVQSADIDKCYNLTSILPLLQFFKDLFVVTISEPMLRQIKPS